MRTKPHTVRFDEDKLKLALNKSKTNKVQKMVDEAVDVFLDAEKVIVSVNPEKLLEPLNADEYLIKEIKVGFALKEENKRYKIINGKKVFK